MIFKFSKEKQPENLKEVVVELEKIKKELEKVKKEIEILKEENKFNVQKVAILRYNPFKDVGSNQSFSIAILDGKDDGVVITSYYSKEGNKVFAKPIKGGKSEYILTEEEEKVIKLAKNERDSKTTSSSNFGPH